jgi:transcriptional regulator with XRE-family HTH domain
VTTEGDEVRARRARLGIDVKPLAELAGVNRDTLAAIEAGQGFRTSSLGKIKRALEQLEEAASRVACVTGSQPDRVDVVVDANERDMGALAGRVRSERRRRRWTQQELADAADVSLGTVSNFERRKSDPQAAHLRAILRALDIEAEGADWQVSQTRSGWPPDVRVFLDVMGVYLTALNDEKRESVIHNLTHQIIGNRH